MRNIGAGGFGVVCQAVDTRTGQLVAIKKALKPFLDVELARRHIREIKLLSHFDHENIIKLCDLGRPASRNRAEDILTILEFMPTDLDKTIRGGN